jgi:hypothetical protein
MESLKNMASYDIEVLLSEHFGARSGEDAKQHMSKSMESAKQTRHLINASLARTKDEKKSVEEITTILMKDAPDEFLPKEIITLVVGQMIHFFVKRYGALE